MKNNELLGAIAVLLDEKLDARLEPIKTDIREMKEDISTLQTEVKEMKEDIGTLQTEVKEMKEDIGTLQTEVREMKTEILTIKEDVHGIHLFQENVILPRLNTIESCYTDTYKRYRSYNSRMEAAFEDIDILKEVVAGHSEKLKLIC